MLEAAGLKDAVETAEAMTPEQVAELPRAALDQFAPHPLNPDHRHNDPEELEGLKASIEHSGVLAPAIVASREAVVREDPSLGRKVPASVKYVILDGNRRWGASKLANQPDLPYMLRDDLAAPGQTAEIFLATNVHPLELRPMEEAHGYQRTMKYLGIKQEALAARVGISQSRISKAIKLLELPEVVQDAVDAGRISPHAARDLLKIEKDEIETVYLNALALMAEEDRTDSIKVAAAVRAGINRAQTEAEQRQAIKKAHEDLRSEGVTIIDPDARFGADAFRHELRKEEVGPVRQGGGIAGAVVHPTGRVAYYSTNFAPRFEETDASDSESTSEKEAGYSNGISGAPTAEAADKSGEPDAHRPNTSKEARDSARKALKASLDAHSERTAAIGRLLAGFEANTLVDVLADAVLALPWVSEDGGASIAEAAGRLVGVDTSRVAIENLLKVGARPDRHKAALAVALGVLEVEAARPAYASGDRRWPEPIRQHVERLFNLGHYELSDYDKGRLQNGEDPR